MAAKFEILSLYSAKYNSNTIKKNQNGPAGSINVNGGITGKNTLENGNGKYRDVMVLRRPFVG